VSAGAKIGPRQMTGRCRPALVAVWAALVAACAAPAGAQGPSAATSPAGRKVVVLGLGGYWRQHVTRMPPRVSAASAKAAGGKVAPADRILTRAGGRSRILPGRTAPPPADWMKPDFDDGAWDRTRGPVTGRHEFGLLCRRGKFLVADPPGVTGLSLDLTFCGGAAVWLNGAEVARAALPKRQLAPDTPGDDYPLGAFFVAEGPRKGKLLHSYNDRKLLEQFALRRRTAGAVALPVRLLRKGVNVLAVAVHRSDYPADCRKAGMGSWAPVALRRLLLRAEGRGGAILSAMRRPAGLSVWNAEITEEVTELDYAPPGEPLAPVRIAALRNGRWSGQVVAGSPEPIKGLRAACGALTRAEGGAIPASAVTVRYGRLSPWPIRNWGGTVYGGPSGPSMGVYFHRFDGLEDRPPKVVAVTRPAQRVRADVRQALGLPPKPDAAAAVPIWVTVRVPADCRAGTYQGRLTISADGHADVVVPVHLDVADWTLPDVRDYVSELSVYQSPDTLADYYKVTPFSDAHWRLIERSVRLIGEAGNHTILLPLLSKSQTGNARSYLSWVKKPDGTFGYDSRVLERYVDLYLKHHDPKRIKAVCLIVWGNAGVAAGNPYRKEKYDERGLPKKTRGVFTVTAMDPATGARRDMPLPALGSPEYEAFWRSSLVKVRGILTRRKLGDKIAFGMPADPRVPAPAAAVFHRIFPDVGWFVGNHPGATKVFYDLKDRTKFAPVVHVERVYTSALPDPAVKRNFGWRRGQMALAFNRYGFGPLCLYPTPSVWAFRCLMEADLASGHRGAGRIGADYWPMGLRTGSGGAGTYYARFPHSAIGQTGMASNCSALLAPGTDGPVTTGRFENVREGIANAEAVIFIQKALLDKRVPGDLARRAWKVLDERVNAMRTYTLGLGRADWQRRDRDLHETVVAVARHLRDHPASQPASKPADR